MHNILKGKSDYFKWDKYVLVPKHDQEPVDL